MNRILIILVSLLLAACQTFSLDSGGFDTVLIGGRVIDPETGLDAIRNIGIRDGKIRAISNTPLAGVDMVDVSGLVVAPGFIDLHTHSPTLASQRYQALDGVTTSLELEAGAYPFDSFGTHLRGGALINWGASVGYANARIAVMTGSEFPHILDAKVDFDMMGPAFRQTANPEQIGELVELMGQGLDEGGLGIGLPLDYISTAVSEAELLALFELAGDRQAPIFVHIRRGTAGDISGLEEVIALARLTKAPLHICHLQHSAMGGTGRFLDQIRRARMDGVDITTEAFPYNAGSAPISSAVFFRDWQSIFDISYEDVELAATGERFTKAMWEKVQKEQPNAVVIHHYVKEEWTTQVVAAEDVIIVTDGMALVDESKKVPPQGIGSFARVLGKYVRERGELDLVTALRKMTLLPARRLETVSPAFRYKGRLQVGADADITVFDANKIDDKSTYADPFQASVGVKYLYVNGTLLIRNGELIDGVFPGENLISPSL